MQENFQVVDETTDFLVVEKPAGLLVHPTKPGGPRTLLDGLRDLLCYELVTGGSLGIVNRLDRETSGLVLVAKHSRAASELARIMSGREVEKQYFAICFGWPVEDHFQINQPILRKGEVAPSKVWLLRAVHPDGQHAETGFEVLGRFRREEDNAPYALLLARPRTGRTHQIRVHLAWAGYPVVGDKLYGKSEDWYLRFIEQGWTNAMEDALWLPRQALHSCALAFSFRKKTHQFRSPLPPDLQSLLPESFPNPQIFVRLPACSS